MPIGAASCNHSGAGQDCRFLDRSRVPGWNDRGAQAALKGQIERDADRFGHIVLPTRLHLEPGAMLRIMMKTMFRCACKVFGALTHLAHDC